ncbi:hypothetical protein HID58_018709, partial [Brassica napus]
CFCFIEAAAFLLAAAFSFLFNTASACTAFFLSSASSSFIVRLRVERRRKSSALVAFAGETYRKSRTLAPSSSACVPNSLAKVFFIPLSLSSSLDKLFLGPISFPGVSANSGLQTDFCWVLGCGDDNGSGCWSAATFERLSLFWGFFPIPITFRRSSTATFTMSSIDFWSTNGFLNRASIRSNFLESLSRVLAMAIRLALLSYITRES